MFIDDSEHIVFSVFELCDLKQIEFLLSENEDGKSILYQKELNIKEDIIPRRGGAHFPKAVFFKPQFTDCVIQYTNYWDGWVTLSNYISRNLNIPFYQFSFSNQDTLYKKFSFQKYESGKISRLVYAMQDPKWIYHEQGTALDFENLDNYKRRRIKDKLTKSIIIEYCKALNLNIVDDCFWETQESALFYEKRW